jgi:hypothetical protein
MIPGPDRIVACPSCRAPARHLTLASGNTFGARAWTDGKQIAPMLPRPPAVVRCRRCAACYWLADAEQVGSVDRWNPGPDAKQGAFADAEPVQEPSEAEYYDALRLGLARDDDAERALRIFAWHRSNEPFRDAPAPTGAASRSPEWRANLRALAALLDEADRNMLLLKAEALRELGDWDEARALLDRVADPQFAPVVRQLRSLCEARDSNVHLLRFGE